MTAPRLRLHDGFAHTSPQRRGLVKELQCLLHRYRPDVIADGLFGPGTQDAVRAFQRACGLPVDGVVGPATREALLEPSTAAAPERFATAYPLDHPILLEDLAAAARYGAAIDRAAAKSGLWPALIVALGSKQSRWGLALDPKGPAGSADFAPRPGLGRHRTGPLPPDAAGFRRGLMQLDFDVHELARAGDWRDAEANIAFACGQVAELKRTLRARTMLAGRAVLRAALAAWDCGLDNVLRAVRQGLDVDFFTAGRDFAGDVLDRTGFFQAHGWD